MAYVSIYGWGNVRFSAQKQEQRKVPKESFEPPVPELAAVLPMPKLNE